MKPPLPDITPLNSVVVSSPPAVNVPAPSVMFPAPAIEPTTSVTPLRSNVDEAATVTADEFGTEPDPLSFSVPTDTAVEPL